ncbi:phosphomevalonate kinase-like [Plakobranchus ocellatus]|uniref:Phosphomevalonate kinase n=1 Tax=Plakobranchus ocellatus TaxID=259542 RepID=A0AAV4DCQ7_9GAST|nr:phosphomevalonate kinase-like [Plakobranchus ocellatus]
MVFPKAIIVISGKRKSGKDFVSEILLKRLGQNKCGIFRLSGPLKRQYAKEHNLDFEKLLDATEYKEKYRADMILWGEERRRKDPGFFCQLATSEGLDKEVWIISDARRLTDVDFFKLNYCSATITVRVDSERAIREQRGFVFTEGIDDAESECGLDSGVKWDLVVYNNDDKKELEDSINKILDLIALKLKDH